MDDLLYLILECEDKTIEQIVLADKKDETAESIIADNQWRNIQLYLYKNDAVESVLELLLKVII